MGILSVWQNFVCRFNMLGGCGRAAVTDVRSQSPQPSAPQRPRSGALLLLLTILVGLSSLPATAGNDYVYDELGRVVQVTDSAGASVQYLYDAAGNITSVKRVAAGELSVSEFTPNSGPVGTTVTLFGSGFNATANLNTVKLNGTTAVVTAATTSRLTVTVPSGATTGTISVTVGVNTAASGQSFTVTAGAVGPAISSFTPIIGAAGTVVTINGSNFESVASKNQVRFNGVFTSATGATSSQITTTVPLTTASGKIRVGTPTGVAVSPTDFFVPPSGYTATDVATTARTNVDGASSALAVATVGKIGMLLFDGVKGQNLGLGISAVTFTPNTASGTIYIKSPNGSDLMPAFSFNNAGTTSNLPTLPATGTYTLVVVPTASTVSMTVTISQDLGGTTTVDAPPITLTTTRIGQNGRYTFNGSNGQRVALTTTGSTFPGLTYIYLYKPAANGSASTTDGALTVILGNSYTDVQTLPVAGTYTVFVDVTGQGVGGLTLQLASVPLDLTGTITVDGPPIAKATTSPGQNIALTFVGTAGQNLGFGISGLSFTTGSTFLTVTIYKPDGTVWNPTSPSSCSGGWSAPGTRCALPNLPVSGIYTILIDPAGNGLANMTVTLNQDVAATLPIDGAATSVTLGNGQFARYSFNGVAGQSLGLGISALSFGAPSSFLTVTIYKPDGTVWSPTSPISCAGGWTAPGARCALPNLPVSGIYTILIAPAGSGTATMTVTLKQDVAGTLAIGGAAATPALGIGQNARYTFTGTAGQNLGLGISGLSFGAPSTYLLVTIYKPDGTTWVPSAPLTCSGGWYAPGNRCGLPNLPVSGVYTIAITPVGTGTASMTVTLKQDVAGTLAIGGAAATPALGIGQNARYTFTGTAGQNLGLGIGGLSFGAPSTYLLVTIYKPDGTTWVPSAPLTCAGGWSAPGNRCGIPNLPVGGVYTILITPVGSGTASMTVTLSSDLTGSLTVNGVGLPFSSTRVGQFGRYTFTATAGQNYSMLWSASTIPAGTIYILKPDLTQLNFASINNGAGAAGTLNLGALATAGVYTVFVSPNTVNTGNVTVRVTSP